MTKLSIYVIAIFLLIGFCLPEKVFSKVKNEITQQEAMTKAAKDFIDIAIKLYDKSAYEQAEKYLLMAVEYQAYLDVADIEKLNQYLEKSHKAAIEKKKVVEHIRIGDELMANGKLVEAKAHFELVKSSGLLNELEFQPVEKKIAKINKELKNKEKEMVDLYNSSVEFYRLGQFGKAREGFEKVVDGGSLSGQMAEEAAKYLAEIKNKSAVPVSSEVTKEVSVSQKAAPMQAKVVDVPKSIEIEVKSQKAADEGEIVSVAEPEAKKTLVVKQDDVDSKKKVLRGYAKALVRDAVSKVRVSIEQGRYQQAQASIKEAEQVLAKNRESLGGELFNQYKSELQQLGEKIAEGKTRWLEDK